MIYIVINLIKYGNMYYSHNKLKKDEILKYSLLSFRNVLKYAYKNSNFYYQYYNSHNIKFNDLDNISVNDIPTIDKNLVRENFYNICTQKIQPHLIEKAANSNDLLPKINNLYLVHTSGSTGTPCNFIYDKRALNILEANFARLSIGGLNKIGIKDFPIKSLYIAPVGSGYACTALAIFGMKIYHCESVIINAQTPLSEWKNIIKTYSPTYLSGYPSCLNLVAGLQEKGEINIYPKKIITGGEPLTNQNATYYKKTFGADVINQYGCTESILIGAGSSFYNGIYLFDDLNYVETDKNNRLIITPLYNNAFPLIRYKLSDLTQGFTRNYNGVLPYTHIDKIIGREEELMWFINEYNEKDFLHPLFLDDLNVKGIEKYQFEQINLNSFILRCINSEDSKILKKTQISKQLDDFLISKKMKNVKYKIEFVDNIPINKITGKSKLVINNQQSGI